MPTIKSEDRSADWKHCKAWSTNHRQASCDSHKEQKYHHDSQLFQFSFSPIYIFKLKTHLMSILFFRTAKFSAYTFYTFRLN